MNKSIPTNTFGLSERDMHTIFHIFSKYPEIKTIYIFGSRAKGNFKTGSDIDLAVMNDNVNFSTILHLKNDLEESSLPYKVDLVYFQDLTNPDFIEHIKRVGKLFYQRKD